MSLKKKIKEANKLADRLISDAENSAVVWYKRPCRISNGQALMCLIIAVAIILIS
jgi:hypothetical protein